MKLFKTDSKDLLHYLLLTLALFIGFYIGNTYFNLQNLGGISMFIFWFVIIFISDKILAVRYIIHLNVKAIPQKH